MTKVGRHDFGAWADDDGTTWQKEMEKGTWRA
jgi:hypothetical protein